MQESMEQAAISPEESILVEESAKTDNGSPASVGKFANSDELLKAYQRLEAEFTKKCQQLKEAERRSEPSEAAVPQEEGSAPLYEREEWEDRVATFTEENPVAAEYAAEISSILKDEPDLAKDERCLEIALGKAVAKHYRRPESIIEDENFLEKYVYRNDKIRDKVIGEYLEGLSPLIGAPRTIPHGGAAAIIPPSRARSIEEAGAMAEKLINARRI